MQKNRDVIEHYYLEEQGQFVTPRIKPSVFQRHTKFVRLLPKYFASLVFFAVVPAERPLEVNSKGKLTSLNISKDFNAKNRDVIEHYLEQQGPVCITQRHEQDAMCNTPLSYKKCLLKSWARFARII